MELKPRYMTLDGLRIRVCEHNADLPSIPLLFFNGIGGSMELIYPFLEEMRNTRVIIYDVPGAGRSQSPGYPWRPRRHAALAAELVERLGFAQVDILGISWGGMLAQQFAKQFPTVCRRLILAATTTGNIAVPPRLAVMLRMSSPLRYLVPEYMEKNAGKLYGGSLRTNKVKAANHAANMKAPSVLGYYYQMFSLLGWTSLPWLHKIKQPTLVLAGDDDPIIPLVNARVMAARIPNARLRVVDCGHLFLLTRARRLVPEIESFLR